MAAVGDGGLRNLKAARERTRTVAMSCGVPAIPGCSSLVLALQAIHHLEQEVGTGLHRFVLGAFQIDPGIAILDPEMRCLGRRWR